MYCAGLALRARVPIGISLSTAMFKAMQGCEPSLQDLEQVDPQMVQSLQKILDLPGSEVEALDLRFVASDPLGGDDAVLLPGGSDVVVTEGNRHEYVALTLKHLAVTRVDKMVSGTIQVSFPSSLLGLLLLVCVVGLENCCRLNQHALLYASSTPGSRVLMALA